MDLKYVNKLIRKKKDQEALGILEELQKKNPDFFLYQQKIDECKILLKKYNLHSNKAKINIPLSIFELRYMKSVKGISAGNALVVKLAPLPTNYYYKLKINTEIKIDFTVSIREIRRNLPIYQKLLRKEEIAIGQSNHIFWVPPSVCSPITISLHLSPSNNLNSLKESFFGEIVSIDKKNDNWLRPVGLDKPIIASLTTTKNRMNIAIDAVMSLLNQVDKIHLHINDTNYIPSALCHPKIIISTESKFGNSGDSGKFIGASMVENAIVLICDDDFIFPHDFVAKVYHTLNQFQRKVVVGMHGIFMRYPVYDYYDYNARCTMHYTTGFNFLPSVAVVGTGAIMFDSTLVSLHKIGLDYSNMADIWFALECCRIKCPIVIQKRDTNWLIENPPEIGSESIWKDSVNNIQSASNTRKMQTFVFSCNESRIFAVPYEYDKRRVRNYVLLLSRQAFIDNISAIETLSKTLNSPAVIYVHDVDDISAMYEITRGIYADIVFECNNLSADSLIGLPELACYDYIAELGPGCATDLAFTISLLKQAEALLLTSIQLCVTLEDGSRPIALRISKPGVSGVYWPAKVDGIALNKLIAKIQSRVSFVGAERFKFGLDHVNVFGSQNTYKEKTISFNQYFNRVYLLNLDRRADRLKGFSSRAQRFGIEFERVSALDGGSDIFSSDYELVLSNLKRKYNSIFSGFKYESSFYTDYESEPHRIEHLLIKNGRTFSKGGYGYLLTYKKILHDALEKGYKRFAIFDDDCLFHRNYDALFRDLVLSVPVDWVCLSLGTLQYNWDDRFISWWATNVYRCNGFSIGSHAQAYSHEAIPMLLNYINRFTLPFDIGPLHYLKRYYSTKSFIAYPNLFIQDVSDTDIGDSSVQLREGSKRDNVYRWDISDYE